MNYNQHFKSFKSKLLASCLVCSFGMVTMASVSIAEDCTGVLPGANCTLDEDTTADLTIDNGVTLSIGTSVTLGHDIDGSILPGDGVISTFGVGTSINQTSDIGATTAIEELQINDDNTWTTSGAINTDNDGLDINLGAVDGGETLNFISGGSFSGEIDGNNGDIVNFGSDGNGGAYATGGQIESVTLIITSGSLDVNNTVGGGAALNSVSIADGASMTMNSNVTTSGALDLDGRLNISSGITFAADSYVADADAGQIVIEVARNAGATEVGAMTFATGVGGLDFSNDSLEVTLDDASAVLINETLTNFIVGNTAPIIGPSQFIDNSFLYNFELQASGNNYDLVITVNPLESVADTENNLNVAKTVMSALSQIDNIQVNQIQSLLGSDASSAAFNERLESLQPTVDGGFVAASLAVSGAAKTATHERVKTLFRDYRGEPSRVRTNVSKKIISGSKDLRTGRRIKREVEKRQYNTERKGSLWAQPFASTSTQNAKDTIDGFDSDNRGLVIGMDSGNMHDDMMVGIAVTGAETDITSKNANRATTDVTSYGIDLFGGVKIAPKTVIDTSASYVHNKNSSIRYSVGGVSGTNADADYVSQQLSLHSRLSHRYKTKGNLTITPSATFNYDHITVAEYEEAGAQNLALAVDHDAINKMAIGAGVDLEWEHQTEGGTTIRPKAYAKYSYDFANDGVRAISNFRVSEKNKFVTEGFEPQRSQINLGSVVDVHVTEKMKLSAGYDFEYKDEYDAHTGHVSIVRDFY